MKVVWTDTAFRHLKNVRDYIESEDPGAARKISGILFDATTKLAEFPNFGRPGRVPNTRELIIPGYPFIIPYTVDNNQVVILAVMHSSRNWPETF